MGVDSRRPLLPAPTDSTFHEGTGTGTGGSVTGTDLATDVSRRTDRTSYSIPDDGSPVTISTRRRRDRERERERERDRDDSKLSRSGHQSQTSLLIEYFEAGKRASGLHSRPSVRVRVTPSSRKRKDKEKDDGDRIHISEGGSGRKPSYTRRISLGTPSRKPRNEELEDDDDDSQSVSSVASAPEDIGASRRPPLEIEFVKPDKDSDVSRYIQPTSDISTIPPDSMLDSAVSKRRPSHHEMSDEDETLQDDNLLQTPAGTRSRSLSRERIAQKAAEKVAGSRTRSRQRASEKGRSPKNFLDVEVSRSPRRKSARQRDKEFASPESSLLTNSALSSQLKAGDQYSFRSNTSKSSINNPRLLETVEDAIRRLILPELKELKKDQKVQANRSKFERDSIASHASGSAAKDELSRKLSKHSSAPDVTRRRHASDDSLRQDTASPLAQGKENQTSPSAIKIGRRPSAADDEVNLHRKKSKGLRHAEEARIVGARLTEAALKHHDSHSTLDTSERRRRPSLGPSIKSPVEKINETELLFQKHDVPPMPFRSEIDTELTRDSILSQQTDTSVEPVHGEVPRASVQQLADSASPRDSPSLQDRDAHYEQDDHEYDDDHYDEHYDEHEMYDDREQSPYLDPPRAYIRGRALSPIQSVASEREDHRETVPSRQSQTPAGQENGEDDRTLDIDSLSSAPSTDLARSTRALTITPKRDLSTDRNEESGVELGYEPSPREPDDPQWNEYHDESDLKSGSGPDSRRMTTYTDDDYEDDEGDHDLSGGIAGNARLIHDPMGMESDVASLVDPSVVNSANSPGNSLSNGHGRFSPRGSREINSPGGSKLPGSPLKQVQDASSPVEESFSRRMGVESPPQSVENSSSDEYHEQPRMGATALPGAGSPIPEIGHIPDSESEINTNPSIIQGPIGGISHENRDHWPYDPTPPGKTTGHSPYDELAARGAAAGLGKQYSSPDYAEDYGAADKVTGHPPVDYDNRYDPSPIRDEGYISGANHRSTNSITPEPKQDALAVLGSPLDDDDDDLYGDSGHKRHLSGYSHGMSSPLYDSATGYGIDRIQSRDIVALMDHLTVRDAQRNARDTEMLITLVRSAAEMRNSFEDMKKFIAAQDELLMTSNNQAHDKTQKAIGGPRPYPGKTTRQIHDDEEEMRAKRKSIFKRALKGLTSKNSNDLARIEDMLEHLLGEVEALRDTQGDRTPRGNDSAPASIPDDQRHQQVLDKPRSLGTASPRRSLDVNGPTAGRRISPVMEDDDEDQDPLTPQEQTVLNHQMVTDTHLLSRHKRGGSMPVETPERAPGALSTDTTPKNSNEKSRKHKSSSSSFFPKFSRWSKTTASSMGDNIRSTMQSGRKDRASSEMSRSGSDLAQGMYTTGEYYDPQGDDRLRSEASLAREKGDRPPSPLVPSQVSDNPRYKAHRNSLNLQHPQPRPGARYQNHLECEAQNFGPYSSPKSEAWASNPTLNVVHPDQVINRHHSPLSDGGYSFVSSRSGMGSAPPRPPKIRDDGPLIPRKPAPSTAGSQASYAERMAMRDGGRPGTSAGPPGPQRRLTGPRPYASSGKYAHNQPGYPRNHQQQQQYRGSPVQVDDDDY